MSDIVRKPLPPIGIKSGAMSERDAGEYAKELIRIALFGPATYHPDGGRIRDKHRLERLRQVPEMLRQLGQRVTNVEGSNALRRMQRDGIPRLADRIQNKVEAIENGKYRNFPRPIVPDMDTDWAMQVPEWERSPRRYHDL